MTQADVEAVAPVSPPTNPSGDQLDFYALPRPIQDRLLASVSGSGAPRVLLFQAASVVKGIGPILVFVMAASVVLGLAVAGYGSLKSPFAIQDEVWIPVYGAAGGLAAVALAAYAWIRSAPNRYPYRFGAYLFPAGVLVAERQKLRWHRLGELRSLQAVGRDRASLRFDDGSFTFPLPNGVSFEQLQQSIEEAKQRLKTAAEQRDRRALAALDPLRDSGFSNPLSSQHALRRPRDQRLWRYTLALIIGASIGVLLFMTRNKLGERELYQRALEADQVQAYQDYLARGGQRPEVAQILLPRVQLGQLRGKTQELESFSRANPDSKIRAEIDLALREALLGELEQVRAAGTLEALSEFVKRHPDHRVVEAELGLARRAVFDAAFATYVREYAPSEAVQKRIRAMISLSEQQGPEVELRFRRNSAKSAKTADSAIRRSAYYGGSSSLPSQYFEDEHMNPREQDALRELAESLQRAFPPEVLRFVPAANAEGDSELPEVQRPTWFITYRFEMSGGYTTNRPRNVYVGLGLTMNGDWVVPGVEENHSFKFSKWLPPDVSEISRENMKPEDVYDKNARLGFAQFNERLLAELLPRKSSN